jgi:phosphoglycerate dehydrogenase-like enzyme
MGARVLVTARAFWHGGEAAEERLRAAGFEVDRAPRCGPCTAAELAPLLQDRDAVIASADAYTAALFAACPRLKAVARWGIGIDSVDLEAATAAGVVVTNTPGTVTEAVADYAFAMLLGIARRIAEGDAVMRAGGWGELPGSLVWGKTLGLVGYGQIGQAVARRAAGFAMRVLAYDPYQATLAPDAPQAIGRPAAEFVALDELMALSDYVSVHAAATPETRGMFDAARLALMKPTAYFINTARGALVDEDALRAALDEGLIAGAAVDVYSAEPLPPDHPLRAAPRCVLTPHTASMAVEAVAATTDRVAANLIALWHGDRAGAAVVNPAVWDSPALRLRTG